MTTTILNWLAALGSWTGRLLFRDRELDLKAREREAENNKTIFEQQQALIAQLRIQLGKMPDILEAMQKQRDLDKEEIFQLRFKNQEYRFRIAALLRIAGLPEEPSWEVKLPDDQPRITGGTS